MGVGVVVAGVGAQPGHGVAVDGGAALLGVVFHAADHTLAPFAGGPFDGQVGGGDALFQGALVAGGPEELVDRVHGRRRAGAFQAFGVEAEAGGPVLVPVGVALLDLDVADQPVFGLFMARVQAGPGFGQGQAHVFGEVFHQRVEVQQRVAEAAQGQRAVAHFHEQGMAGDAVLERHQGVPEPLRPGGVFGERQRLLVAGHGHAVLLVIQRASQRAYCALRGDASDASTARRRRRRAARSAAPGAPWSR